MSTSCPTCNRKVKKIIKIDSSMVNECAFCSLAYTTPPPHNYNYIEEDFHGDTGVQFSEFDKLPKRWQKCLKMQLKLIQKNLKIGSSILEIGCGDGLLLNLLNQNGYNTVGVEPGKHAAQKALSKGLNIINDYFPSNQLHKEFDCVVLSHVLEHVNNPNEFLNQIFTITNAQYLLLVQTNYKGLMPRLMKKGWYGWALNQHYWHFTLEGIRKIINKIDGNFHIAEHEFSSMEYIGSRKALVVDYIAKVIPSVYDQMHILIKKN